jgi:hypothetical protein
MFRRAWIFALALTAAQAWAQSTLPADYQSWTGEKKSEFLWKERVLPTAYPALPPITAGIPNLLKGFLSVAFDHTSDEMPEGRRKFIHGFGAVGLVEFEPKQQEHWNGLFKTGAKGIARFSVAGPPKPDRFTPGLALKFFVAGRPSVNLHVMHDLEGIKVWNFFEKEKTNILPPPSSLALMALAAAFARVKPDPGNLPVNGLAMHGSDGQTQVEPRWPTQLWFVPTIEVHRRADAQVREDFRAKLMRIEPGTVLYNVYGAYTEDGPRIPLGKLTLRSPIVASQWADEKLFFQHQR